MKLAKRLNDQHFDDAEDGRTATCFSPLAMRATRTAQKRGKV